MFIKILFSPLHTTYAWWMINHFPKLTVLLANAVTLPVVLSLLLSDGTGRWFQRVAQFLLLVGTVLTIGEQVAHLRRQKAFAKGTAVGRATRRSVRRCKIRNYDDMHASKPKYRMNFAVGVGT